MWLDKPNSKLTADASVTLCDATPAGTIGKSLNLTLYFPNNPVYTPCFSPGCCGTYGLGYHNTGNVAQPSPFVIEDAVPPEFLTVALGAYVSTSAGKASRLTS